MPTDVFTATGTWTAPGDVTQVVVECWAGGGAGGKGGSVGGGAGGRGGDYARSTLNVSPGTSYTVTVGAGGVGSTPSSGGDSWFNSTATILAKGGTVGGNGSTTGGSVGAAQSGTLGTVTFTGGTPNAGATSGGAGGGGGGGAGDSNNGGNATGQTGGSGGSAGGGAGGNGPAGGSGTVGGAGTTLGGGGGGGGSSATAPGNGGNGARGEVRVTYTPGFNRDGSVIASRFI